MGLGPYPAVTLAMAREKARAARALIEQGQDPVHERERAKAALLALQAKQLTFDEAARQFIDAKAAEWRNVKHSLQWTSSLETYASPVIGKLNVSAIEQAHVLAVLEPIWSTKTETASRVRGRIEQVLDWSRVRGYREGDNPARWRGHLDKLLPAPRKISKVEHHDALPVDTVPAFMQQLKLRPGYAARALEFAILTAGRSGEVRGATWDEIDIEAAVWTVPAERMKAGKEHRVPLSEHALNLLKALPRLEGATVIFPAPRGGQLSDMAMTALMRRMGAPAVPHGFRSTFRDWCGDRTSFPRDLAEAALAHALESQVEAAYRRSDALERRRQMMETWAKFLATPIVQTNNVTKLKRNVA